jgi:hypothetical protein
MCEFRLFIQDHGFTLRDCLLYSGDALGGGL